ncbi:putative NADPH--cytochrome P450 reductase [Iris pallida]|uniref:NADPH--cytochrome P450 reductase n=1 Tax=Iris pallida TaxID=29817 RepID=A0AAX6E797_IRIPA|nr:putative NADPH--cytochrome P450 reductase [Iris pallida]
MARSSSCFFSYSSKISSWQRRRSISMVFYGCLGTPSELTRWSYADDNDPCVEKPWRCVACSVQSVVPMNLKGWESMGFFARIFLISMLPSNLYFYDYNI